MSDAKQYLDQSEAFWKQMLWTDEGKTGLFGHNPQRYVWRKMGICWEKNPTLPTFKHEGGFIMPWGGMTASSKGNIAQIDGKMNFGIYQQFWKQM